MPTFRIDSLWFGRLLSRLSLIFISGLAAFIEEGEAAGKFKYENQLTLAPAFYSEEIGQGTPRGAAVISEQFKVSLRSSENLKFRFAPWFRADPVSTSPSEAFLADLNEASIEWRKGDLALHAGLQPYSWGVTDIYNPLDVVGSRRFLDPLNAEKRGVPSLDFVYDHDDWHFEGLLIPQQIESILPGENSRWLPRDVSFNRSEGFFRARLDRNFRYNYLAKRVEDQALQANFGARLSRRGAGFDWEAIFFQGAPTAPAIFTPVVSGYTSPSDVNEFIATEISLQPVYYLRRTVGWGGVWTRETSLVRFAVMDSARLSQLPGLPGWSRGAVLGVEKNFDLKTTSLTLLLQATSVANEDPAENTVTSLMRIFDRSYLLGVRWAIPEEWVLSGASLFDAAAKSWFVQTKVEKKIGDGIVSTLKIDWLEGESGSAIGTYRRNKRLIFETTVLF